MNDTAQLIRSGNSFASDKHLDVLLYGQTVDVPVEGEG